MNKKPLVITVTYATVVISLFILGKVMNIPKLQVFAAGWGVGLLFVAPLINAIIELFICKDPAIAFFIKANKHMSVKARVYYTATFQYQYKKRTYRGTGGISCGSEKRVRKHYIEETPYTVYVNPKNPHQFRLKGYFPIILIYPFLIGICFMYLVFIV